MDAGEISEQEADKARCERCGDEEIEWKVSKPKGGFYYVGANCNLELPDEWERVLVDYEPDPDDWEIPF